MFRTPYNIAGPISGVHSCIGIRRHESICRLRPFLVEFKRFQYIDSAQRIIGVAGILKHPEQMKQIGMLVYGAWSADPCYQGKTKYHQS